MDHYASTGSAGAVCAAFGISRPTFRKWLRRFEEQGEAGLDEPSRRPASMPNRKVFEREEQEILRLRREQRFGIHKIKTALLADGIALSTDTILKVLRRAGEAPLRTPRRSAEVPRPAILDVRLHEAALPSDDRLSDAIASLITDGRFRPGEKLSEVALATALGSGRAGIRAALQRLAPTGLVVLHRNRGAFVSNPSASEIEQAYAARRLIESETVADLCRHCTAHDVRRLRRHVEAQRDAERAGERGALIRLLTDFHVVIACLGENRILADFVRTLAAKTSLAVVLYDHQGSSCAIAEHLEIVDRIAAGDVTGAQRLMRRHLAANRGRLPHPTGEP